MIGPAAAATANTKKSSARSSNAVHRPAEAGGTADVRTVLALKAPRHDRACLPAAVTGSPWEPGVTSNALGPGRRSFAGRRGHALKGTAAAGICRQRAVGVGTASHLGGRVAEAHRAHRGQVGANDLDRAALVLAVADLGMIVGRRLRVLVGQGVHRPNHALRSAQTPGR